jgi:hypothetical protein
LYLSLSGCIIDREQQAVFQQKDRRKGIWKEE